MRRWWVLACADDGPLMCSAFPSVVTTRDCGYLAALLVTGGTTEHQHDALRVQLEELKARLAQLEQEKQQMEQHSVSTCMALFVGRSSDRQPCFTDSIAGLHHRLPQLERRHPHAAEQLKCSNIWLRSAVSADAGRPSSNTKAPSD